MGFFKFVGLKANRTTVHVRRIPSVTLSDDPVKPEGNSNQLSDTESRCDLIRQGAGALLSTMREFDVWSRRADVKRRVCL